MNEVLLANGIAIVIIVIYTIVVNVVFRKKYIKQAKQELVKELTNMVENNEEITLTIVRNPKGL